MIGADMSPAITAPRDCWYAPVSSADVTSALLPLRVAGLPIVLFRADDSTIVASLPAEEGA
ncbi:MAG TPA: hypothetical protein DCQ36_05470 [Actinobacteria bacterium]|nr:hypothetical protein [Actinomycetota bacterium]